MTLRASNAATCFFPLLAIVICKLVFCASILAFWGCLYPPEYFVIVQASLRTPLRRRVLCWGGPENLGVAKGVPRKDLATRFSTTTSVRSTVHFTPGSSHFNIRSHSSSCRQSSLRFNSLSRKMSPSPSHLSSRNRVSGLHTTTVTKDGLAGHACIGAKNLTLTLSFSKWTDQHISTSMHASFEDGGRRENSAA